MHARNLFSKTTFFILLLATSLSGKALATKIEISDTQTAQTILAEGDELLITNSGSVIVADDAIRANGNNAQITNNGILDSTAGNENDGIHVSGDQVTIINNNIIRSTVIDTNNNNGVYSTGSLLNIINNGTITSNDDGISIQGGSDATITNNGSINADDLGIYSDKVGTEIINNGLIDTNTSGIELYSNNASITNNGTIESFYSIFSQDGTNTSITNNNSIAGGEAGIAAITTNDLQIINSGTITATDYAVYTEGNNVEIVNSGTITADDYATYIVGDNVEITNSGTITAANHAFYIEGNNVEVVNSGTITSTDTDSYAILGNTNNNQSVILRKGSRITGIINLSGPVVDNVDFDSLTVTGNGLSAKIVTENIESLNITSKVAGVVAGNTIHTIDPTGAAMLTLGINKLTADIHNVTSNRSKKTTKSKKSKAWSQVFGSNFSRAGESQNLSYDSNRIGFVAGYESDSESNSFAKGLIFGISSGDMRTNASSFTADVKSVFTGIYGNINLSEKTTLSSSIIAGYERYETKRLVLENLSGLQVAHSDFTNFFISPSVAVEHNIKINEELAINPTARISYTNSLFGDHRESGTSSNLTTKNRTAHILNSRAGLKAVMKFDGGHIELESGLDNRTIKEDDVNANIDSTSFRYATNNDESVNGKYMRIGANIANFKGLTLNANFEKRRADGNEKEDLMQIGALYRF